MGGGKTSRQKYQDAVTHNVRTLRLYIDQSSTLYYKQCADYYTGGMPSWVSLGNKSQLCTRPTSSISISCSRLYYEEKIKKKKSQLITRPSGIQIYQDTYYLFGSDFLAGV